MTITLASLVSRLEAAVPAVSGVPSSAQYEQAVKDAVADLSRRASVVRVATLSIVAGTASYTVPSDFQRLIRLAQVGALYPFSGPPLSWDTNSDMGGGTFVTPAGLVPFSGSYREQITITGDQLTIYPTPQTSASRQLIYAAGDALLSGEYATLTEDRASIALLLAQASCLDRQATATGGTALGKVGGLGFTIDDGVSIAAQRTQAADLRAQYLAAIASLNAGSGGLG